MQWRSASAVGRGSAQGGQRANSGWLRSMAVVSPSRDSSWHRCNLSGGAARQPGCTVLQARRHPGRVWFEVDVPPGEPSPWLTFYATRVLEWWDTTR